MNRCMHLIIFQRFVPPCMQCHLLPATDRVRCRISERVLKEQRKSLLDRDCHSACKFTQIAPLGIIKSIFASKKNPPIGVQVISRILRAFVVVPVLFLAACSNDPNQTDYSIRATPKINPLVPVANQPILLTAIIENRDFGDSPQTTAAVQVDGKEAVRVMVDSIPGGGTRAIATSFTVSTVGGHSITVIVDPDNSSNDPDRGNNYFTFGLVVGVASAAN